MSCVCWVIFLVACFSMLSYCGSLSQVTLFCHSYNVQRHIKHSRNVDPHSSATVDPSKHETMIVPTSATLAQHQPSIGSKSRVCWDANVHYASLPYSASCWLPGEPVCPLNDKTGVRSQRAVTAYFSSKQLLPFCFGWQIPAPACCIISCLLSCLGCKSVHHDHVSCN